MKLIGISGKKQSGKDTVADIIKCVMLNKGVLCERHGFADALKSEIAEATGLTLAYMEQRKDVFRTIYQWWGTDFRRNLFGKDYWLKLMDDYLFQHEDEDVLILIPDVRFSNEATHIHKLGGRVIRISRITTADDKHPSETELTDDNFPYNHTIVNDGTLDDLEQNVLKMLNKFKY